MTDAKHRHPIAPDVLERDVTTTASNQAWVTDITRLWTQEGWHDLAAILPPPASLARIGTPRRRARRRKLRYLTHA
jgi:transposase InsO family protein